MPDNDLTFYSAKKLVSLMIGRELSAEEVMRAHLERIQEVNPALNAIVTLDIEGALAGDCIASAEIQPSLVFMVSGGIVELLGDANI